MKAAIIVIGAGGHAKVCIELLQSMGEQVDFCVGTVGGPPTCVRVPVLFGDEHLARLYAEGYRRLFVAIGANRLRLNLSANASAFGYELTCAIIPHAVLSPSARIGKGVAIMAGAVINAEAVVSDLAIINTGASVDHDCVISSGAHVAPRAALAGNVPVGTASFLGVGSNVIPSQHIGDDVIIGAGAVVISNIGNHATFAGVPARSIK
jgi:UDP-perosamine 4-acetyltransferase